ncbi:MAG: sigma-54-dependent transcriptional regulator [Candidatus Zhuqueibacterota bacterium]
MREKPILLIIDDDSVSLRFFSDLFTASGYDVLSADSGEKGLNLFRERTIDVIILDLNILDYHGLDVVDSILQLNPRQPIIIIAGHGAIENVVQATKSGVFDLLEKPVEPERILLSIKNAIEKTRLLHERNQLIRQPERRYKMVGVSAAMQHIFQIIDRVAPTDTRVLISGESGTGKDLVAQAIHLNSLRADKNFQPVNCASIPNELVESELFGHTKGSFTDARNEKMGTFQLADKGTLFLDEIGDLSLMAQAKVLRAIEHGEFSPIGGTSTIIVDVRIICATNKNLDDMIKAHSFRDDLFHRINGMAIHIPPLRERREDIAPLCAHFLDQILKKNNLPPKRFTHDAIELISDQPWNGNVRQLRNFMEQICVLSDAEVITAQIVAKLLNIKNLYSETMEIENFQEARANFEKNYLLKNLIKFNWNVTVTAEKIGLERTSLHRKMRRYGINDRGESR